MRTMIALGSAAFAALALLTVPQAPAKAEFYRTPAGEVKYRWVDPNSSGPYLFYYQGYAYPYSPGLAYRERTGELRETDRPQRARVQR